jgi:cell division protein FtsB
MAQRSLEERADMLERRVDLLEQLPERVTALETQIVLLRDEMRAEFSATRAQAQVGDEDTRRFMRILYEDLVARIEVLGGRH